MDNTLASITQHACKTSDAEQGPLKGPSASAHQGTAISTAEASLTFSWYTFTSVSDRGCESSSWTLT